MIPLIDFHAHLDLLEEKIGLERLKELLYELEKNNIITINMGINKISNEKSLLLKKKYPNLIKAGVGFYPLEDKDIEGDYNIDEFLSFARKEKNNFIIIGEVGIDLNSELAIKKKEIQISNFKKIISLSKELNKPMSIHTRKAEELIINLLEEENISNNLVILHCFSGRKSLITRAIKKGYYFSLPSVFVRVEQYKLLANLVPLNQLLLETDTPYLSPEKNNINTPLSLIRIINELAKIKSLSVTELKNILFMNYQRIIAF